MIDSLQKECIQIGTMANTKAEIIKEISQLAKKSPILADISQKQIEDALEAREQTMSTGLSKGIAIPHCSFDTLEQFVVGLIVVKQGMDFDSIDGEDSKLIFFIIGSESQRNKHIKILSSISKLCKDKMIIRQLTNSGTPDEARKLLTRSDDDAVSIKKNEKSQFTIHVQKEELFLDVLEVLSSEIEGSVSVLEASTAGSYLYRLPLFSSFWNEKVSHFSKMIVAVVDKKLVNDTIRRINMIMPENKKGIIISVSDIFYFDGSIDF